MNMLKTLARMAVVCLTFARSVETRANPTGMNVVSGRAQTVQNGPQLNITVSRNAFLNWNSFNIAAGESTVFQQPSASSIVWNRIGDANPSQIYGSLEANGIVVLANQSGFYFGPNSFVKAAGLVATTAPVSPSMARGGVFDFGSPPPLIPIVNYGRLETAAGGSLFLIAKQIENHGTLSAPGGTVGLVAGQKVLVSDRPDGRGLSVTVKLPEGSVDNEGRIIADAGHVLMQAQTVNQGGLIQANSVRNVNGVIELFAIDKLELGAQSIIQAAGDSQGASQGGSITLKSDNQFTDQAGASITAAGGAKGGNGGQIEISAPIIGEILSQADAQAAEGWKSGKLFLDPTDINITTSGTGSAGSGTVGANDPPPTLSLNPLTAFKGFSTITLQATHDITLSSSWNLPTSTGLDAVGCQLTLQAGNNIALKDNVTLDGGGKWKLFLATGVNFGTSPDLNGGNLSLGSNAKLKAGLGFIDVNAFRNINLNSKALVQTDAGSISLAALGDIAIGSSGIGGFIRSVSGSIYLTAGGSLTVGPSGVVETSSGLINVLASQNVTIRNNGAIRTIGGGDISVVAVNGTVDSSALPGTATPPGYVFNDSGYDVGRDGNGNISLTGISTAAGGDVYIRAGKDIKSYAITDTTTGDAGLGAFGADAGNVTMIADGNISGNYMLRNGLGIIQAANNAGTVGSPLALNLVKGAWSVSAGNSIALNEVRNPNGVFNNAESFDGANPFKHFFDYDSSASVSLVAANGVELGVGQLPRGTDASDKVPVVYPPTLSIQAGSGGIKLDNQVLLFPSATGTLDIKTTDGGGLFTDGNQQSLIISDSDHRQYTGSGILGIGDHGNNVLHLDDPNPATIDIDGSVSLINIVSPKPLVMTVKGNIDNCSISAQNFRTTDKTIITAGGSFFEPNKYNFVPILKGTAPPDFNLLGEAVLVNSDGTLKLDSNGKPIADPTIQDMAGKFTYSGGVLGYGGKMTATQRDALENMYVLDPLNPLAPPVKKSFVSTDVIDAIYAKAKDGVNSISRAVDIWGPGTLQMIAGSIDLGLSYGIISHGIDQRPALVPYTTLAIGNLNAPHHRHPRLRLVPDGADIDITTKQGDLSMFSSSIMSQYGGNIHIASAGKINVGAGQNLGVLSLPQGIITLWGGNMDIQAVDNVEVDGSRIAAYDGGNIHIESLTGNVDAGKGGNGYVNVDKPYYDSASGEVLYAGSTIPGSGILATSYPINVPGQGAARLGNISVETPMGNIIAGAGGIVQVDLNGRANKDAKITLQAGSTDPDGTVHKGSILAAGSGVIGDQVDLKATGDIKGLVVAMGDLNIAAAQNVNVVAIGQGSVNVKSDSGSVSGTIVGVGTVTVAGASIDANVVAGPGQANVSGNVTGNGGAQAAAPASTAAQATTADAQSTATEVSQSDDEELKKRNRPLLAKHTSRVTDILNGRN
jgi:filamentous hemagglutinin family protein